MRKTLLSIALSMMVTAPIQAEQALHDHRMGEYEKATPALKQMAKKKNKAALYALGKLLMHGYANDVDKSKALAMITESAQRGYQPAQLYLARYNLSLKGNAKTAFHWYKKAADKGGVSAKMYVASAYLHGFGVDKSSDKARKYLIQAARKGNVTAQFELGQSFIKAKRKKTRKAGFNWLMKAAKKGNVKAMLALAHYYDRGSRYYYRDPSKAAYWLSQAEKNNTAQTAYQIGKYYQAQDKRNNDMTALPWLKQAARAGHAKAMFALSEIYLSPKSIYYSLDKGHQWLEQAAKAGNLDAQGNLAKFYKSTQQGKPKPKLAKYWQSQYQKNQASQAYKQTMALLASDPGYVKADYHLAGHISQWENKARYVQGQRNHSPILTRLTVNDIYQPTLKMSLPNTLTAFDIIETVLPINDINERGYDFYQYPLQKANTNEADVRKVYSKALLGNAKAQFRMGQFYEYGAGVNQNTQLAMVWYFEAAKQDDLKAEYSLAVLLLNGKGVTPNFKKALYWLNRSAFKGNTHSQYALALIYEHGYGDKHSEQYIPKDRALSESMYHLAASESFAPAQLKLANFYASKALANNTTVKARQARHQLLKSLYEKAVSQGLEKASLPLAYYYLAGASHQKQLNAFSVAKKQAEQGNVKAALLLGLMFEQGIGTKANQKKALDWYDTAAKHGNPAAQFILGAHYYSGNGMTSSTVKAKSYWLSAAKQGFLPALHNLAVLAKQNNENPNQYLALATQKAYAPSALYVADSALLSSNSAEEKQQAASLFQRLANLGVADAQLKLARLYEQGLVLAKQPKLAKRWYWQAAQQGNVKAQYLLANLYLQGKAGKAGKPEIDKAKYWYKKAVKQHYVPAMNAMGFVEENYQHNYALAKSWYEQAAKQGSMKGQYNLGLLYDYGKTKHDKLKAKQWYEAAAMQGVSKAQLQLAQYYFNLNKPRHYQDALKWYNKAAKAGNAFAAKQAAVMYELGMGTAVDMKQALSLYQQAEEQGRLDASLALARMYQFGQQGEVNKSQAYAHFKRAAKQGHPYATYRVAQYYLNGIQGSEADKEKAERLLKQAAAKGYQPAKLALNKLLESSDKKALMNSYIAPAAKRVVFTEKSTDPSRMLLQAINQLDLGQMDSSIAMLEQIIKRFPDYQPAIKMKKRITQIDNGKLPEA